MSEEGLENAATVVSSTTAAVGELIKAAGESEPAKEAAQNLGKTAVIITSTINNLLLPLAAVNYAFDRARRYFVEKFNDDLEERVREIPADCLIEPKASLAGPALQGLAFSHEEPDLKQLYLELLGTSMDSRSASAAHPAFVEVIKQLTTKEARLLKALLPGNDLSIARIQLELDTGGKMVLLNHLLNLVDPSTRQGVEIPELPSMVDNWIRLGLVQVDYMRYLNSKDAYDWVEQRPEYLEECAKHRGKPVNVSFQKGLFTSTDFGVQFAKATGMLMTKHSTS